MLSRPVGEIDEAGGDAHAAAIVAVGLERREERRRGTGRGRQRGSIDLHLARDAGTRCHDDVVNGRPVDLRRGHADAAARPAANAWKCAISVTNAPLPALAAPVNATTSGAWSLPAPTIEVEHAVAVDVSHRDIHGAFESGKRNDRCHKPVAVAVVQADLRRLAGAPGTATA